MPRSLVNRYKQVQTGTNRYKQVQTGTNRYKRVWRTLFLRLNPAYKGSSETLSGIYRTMRRHITKLKMLNIVCSSLAERIFTAVWLTFWNTWQSVVFGSFRNTWQSVVFGSFRINWQSVVFGSFRNTWQSVVVGSFRNTWQSVVFGSFRINWQSVVFGSFRNTWQSVVFGSFRNTWQSAVFCSPVQAVTSCERTPSISAFYLQRQHLYKVIFLFPSSHSWPLRFFPNRAVQHFQQRWPRR